MISHSDLVYVSHELGRASKWYDEAIGHLRDGDIDLARQRLRGTANRLSRMAGLLSILPVEDFILILENGLA
jgi:hypothetical protein